MRERSPLALTTSPRVASIHASPCEIQVAPTPPTRGKSGVRSTARVSARIGPAAPTSAPPTTAPSDAFTSGTPAAPSARISPRERACSVAMNAAPPPASDTSAASRPIRPANVPVVASAPSITTKTSVPSARPSDTVRRARDQSYAVNLNIEVRPTFSRIRRTVPSLRGKHLVLTSR